MKFLSICIPTYEMHGEGERFLRHNLDVLTQQTFTDFDVVISDHSQGNGIKNLCEEYRDRLTIHYYKNTHGKGSSSANINNAIKHATGTLIKIIFQDDFLSSPRALEDIVEAFDIEKDSWLITACEHSKNGIDRYRPFYPKYHDAIHLGKNTISSPSVLTIRNKDPLLFDENLLWAMDTDYYKRCYDAFGYPKILNTITVVNRVGNHQVSASHVTEKLKKTERLYLLKKYHEKSTEHVTLVAVSSIKIRATIRALTMSKYRMNFHEVLLISDKRPKNLPEGITFKQCPPLQSRTAYSKFMLYDLARYIESEFALVVQHDGYILRPEKWDDTFLHYDYIGAPWKKNLYFTLSGKNVRVGNGGFSLRSKKLLDAFNSLNLPFTDAGTGFYNEDGAISLYYREDLENHGIRFAPVSLASKFSRESDCEDSEPEPFGFHGNKRLIPKLFFTKRRIRTILTKLCS